MRDPIVEEIGRVRREHAEKFNFDLDAIFEDLKQSQRKAGRKAVTLEPRRPRSERSGK